MVSVDTNADEMNVIGNIQMNPAELATSTELADSPMNACTQLRLKANSSSSDVATAASPSVPSNRKPITNATPSITKKVNRLRRRSDTVRPMSTAARDIGSERSRSIKPLLMSSARPTAVNDEPNTSDWAKIPGIRYWS